MNVLVACEESQRVCIEFRALGHNAFSCDILECSGGHPEWHFKQNCLEVIKNKGGVLETGECVYVDGWDLMIAHPPCTYLSNAGARFLYPKGVLNQDRYKKGLKAKKFFMELYNTDIPRICVENPVASKIYELPKCTQSIQPYYFGHPYKKKTNLWLKGLPNLVPTNVVPVSQSTKVAGNWFNKGGKDRQRNRSKTFPGIAKAMADQWSIL